MKVTVIILAAGLGTRMKSELAKVLHPICGRPIVTYALNAAQAVSSEKPVLIIGNGGKMVQDYVGETAHCVIQNPQLGTGHAVLQAESLLRSKMDQILVIYADMPLLRTDTLRSLIEKQSTNKGPITLLTVRTDNPRGFGRVLRNSEDEVQAIVEEAAATAEQLKIHELNVGVYCYSANWLWDALHHLPLSKKGEYYLTDTVELAVKAGLSVQAINTDDLSEIIGVNNRIHLAEAEAAMRQRINQTHMLAGVTIIDPHSTYIEPSAVIGRDTIVWPNTYLHGKTTIGEACQIGPNSIVRDSQIANQCRIFFSVIENAETEDEVQIGPFAHLRKGAHLCKGVHVGNFGEVKNSTLGAGTKMGHFSYIGDAAVNSNVNIGAGTITCNFDGERKNQTEIGEDAFIGSDTMLVAPVKVGARSVTGAGSIVTKDVPPDTLVVGIPARAIKKLERKKKLDKKDTSAHK